MRITSGAKEYPAMFRRVAVGFALATFLLSSAPAQDTVAAASNAEPQQESLADIAKAIRAKKKPEVVVDQEDAEKLFREVDSILAFASASSELPKRTTVKYKLVGRDEVDQHFAESLATSESTDRLQRSELVLKKFGMLPDDFQVQKFLTARGGSEYSGYYSPKEKTMYLLNWIPLEQQRLIMAHELTHALQDQNYDLMKWRNPSASDNQRDGDGIETDARVAAVEGQAMLVYLDYELKPRGMKLSESTDRFDVLKTRIMSAYDSPMKSSSGPLIFTELAKFPYYDGFAFELEVLKRSGTRAAFAGVFENPPRDTHEIMQPDTYLAGTRATPFALPNLMLALGSGYQSYDSGLIGELDVRIMAKQFGRDNDAYSVAPFWNGGAYLAVRKPSAVTKKESELNSADIALMYVSRWTTTAAAERFAELYKSAILKRSKTFDAAAAKAVSCDSRTPDCTGRWYARFDTDQGPVVMEISQDNTLMITQGLEDSAVNQVKLALSRNRGTTQASNESELSLRFMEVPAVQAIREEIVKQMTTTLGGN
jgi:hypothetical protein